MTPLPKRKLSHMRQGQRRASIKLAIPQSQTCAKCGKLRQPHRACPECGFYKA